MHREHLPSIYSLFVAIAIVLVPAIPAGALEKPGENLNEVGVSTERGAQIDLSLKFTNSTGSELALSEIGNPDRPKIIIPVYYHCPRLCGLLLGGVKTLLNELQLQIGSDYDVLTVSFNPHEGTALARKRKQEFTAGFTGLGDAQTGWHFLTGSAENVNPLMLQLGFNYKPDGSDFAHTAAIFLLTPEGKISQYFTGVTFSAFDTKLALIEASESKIGSTLDHVLLFCFRFDPSIGKYTWAAFGVMRAGGIITLVLLIVLFYRLWSNDHNKRKHMSG